ncbi:hypothetical protein JTB14_030416 [Gonioctena quinquepunctata]|nr:hypothetical protein JTB14_030416 [Gonioctena quinquepunctata]
MPQMQELENDEIMMASGSGKEAAVEADKNLTEAQVENCANDAEETENSEEPMKIQNYGQETMEVENERSRDSKVAKDFACKRTKSTTIVKENLGKHKNELYTHLQQPGKLFSMIMDETTDVGTIKQSKVAILDMLASVDVNKHQLTEDEEAILEVIEVDGNDDDDDDEGVDVDVDLEANAGDYERGDEECDGVDVPEEMVDMATCIRDLDICKTIDYIFCNSISYVTIDIIHGGLGTLCAVCFRLYASRYRDPGAMCTHVDVHSTGPYGEMERHY